MSDEWITDETVSGEIILRLPDRFHRDAGKDIPEGLIGSKIVSFGTLPSAAVEGSGLAIDVEQSDGQRRRFVFAFNELGMWVQFTSPDQPGRDP